MKNLKQGIRNKLGNFYSKKKFSTFSMSHPISFKESKFNFLTIFFKKLGRINKNAVILENEHYNTKIIFPDYKFDLNLNIGDKNYTIKQMVEDARKKSDKDNVLTISFLEEDGTLIANSVQASLLTRLNVFQISINGGERIYNCINPRYLGNLKLDKEVVTQNTQIDFEKIEKLMFKDNFSFSTAVSLDKKKSEHKEITYSSILKDYLKIKYSLLSEFHQSIKEARERRIQKFLNLFFYLCLTQTVTLNLGTFVFFSWDFMEPITQCITYLNIVGGYYFWAITQSDYEMDSMLGWMRSRRFFFKPALVDYMVQEKEEIEKLLSEDLVKH